MSLIKDERQVKKQNESVRWARWLQFRLPELEGLWEFGKVVLSFI
jgi:hypothetical protein